MDLVCWLKASWCLGMRLGKAERKVRIINNTSRIGCGIFSGSRAQNKLGN